MKHRILAGVLASCMLVSVNVFSAEEEKRAEFKQAEYTLAQNVMDKLGILEYSEDNLTDVISRVDFAVYLARLLKINEYEMQDYTYYTDIVKNHYGLKSVNYLTEIGGFDGYGNSEFRPDEPISPIAAVKVIFNVLGYKNYAEAFGGYPNAYIEMASKTDLLEGFEGCKDLTREELSVLLFRAGLIEMATMDSKNAGGLVLKSDEGDTAFARYWDVYEKEGVVTSADFTSIQDGVDGKEGYIYFGEEFYSYNEFDASGLLGRYVNALVVENSDTEELLWAVLDEKKTEEITIDADDLNLYSDFSLKYYDENGKIKTETVETDAVFVYNGTVLEYDVAERINNINKGDITLIDSDGNNDADTVIINDYKTYVVGYIDRENEVIYDEFLKTQIIDLENYKYKKIYSMTGGVLDINSISTGCVLNIKESGGVYADIYVASGISSGTVTEIFTDEATGRYGVCIDNDKRFLFDGEFVKNSNWFEDGVFKGNPGISINFITDKFSDIAYITGLGTGNKQIAYTMKIWYADDEAECVRFKLLKSDGNIVTVDASEKVSVDGKRYKSAKEAYDAVCLGDKKVIIYQLDANGKISYIDTSYKSDAETDNSLKEATPIERESFEPQDPRYPGCRQWFMVDRSFNGVIMLSNSTVIFQVPQNPEGKGDEYYGVVNFSSFNDGNQVVCNSYKTSEENFFDDVFVIYKEGARNINVGAPMVAVTKVMKTVTADGDETYKIQGVSKGKAVSYLVEENCMELGFTNEANSEKITDFGELEAGDLIQIATDEKGKISAMRLLVDISDGVDSMPNFANNASRGYNLRGADYALNRVYCKKNTPNGLELTYDKGGAVVWKAGLLSGSPTVTVIDTKGEKVNVRSGNLSDVMSYDVVGENVLPLYIYSVRMYMTDVVVYK